ICDKWALEVGERQTKGMKPGLADESAMERTAVFFAEGPGFLVELAYGVSDLIEPCVGRQRLAGGDRYRIRNGPGQAARADRAEDAAFEPVEMDRDDRRHMPFDDALQAALEWRHHAGARQLAFRKDTNQFAAIQGPARFAEGLQDHLGASAALDRN